SIKDIHGLLNHPSSVHIYMQKQIEKLRQEEKNLQLKISRLRKIANQLPMQVSYDTLASIVKNTAFPEPNLDPVANPEKDAELVCLYLWGSFLHNIEMTEYRQFLWNKLLQQTARSHNLAIYQLKEFLYSLPADRIDSVFASRNLHINKIVALSPQTIPEFVDEMKTHLDKQSQSLAFISYWKDNYKKQIQITTSLYDSEFNALATELSPCFSVYCQNIHECCRLLYEWLRSESGRTTYERLVENLDGCMDLESNHHGELAAMFTM
ncbi:MAG: hypothetical protein II253_04210, partial [Lachnospiraceae bacterium]|nr:hypothetical protein [Lachnospiraceae bacterium]